MRSQLRHVLLISVLLTVCCTAGSHSAVEARQRALPVLPQVWQILWANDVSSGKLQDLKDMGFDGVYKCVAYAPNYPQEPIYAGAEWRLVENEQGVYDWSSLRTCLNNALKANMWFIPELVINIPPEWFLVSYPDSLLKDSRGITSTDPNASGAPYLLSPWFVETGAADAYLQPLISSFLDVVAEYPNVPAIMIGNFKLNVLPWKMGFNNADNFTYWPIFDGYALVNYEAHFGTGETPPATWDDYVAMSSADQAAFRDWLTMSIESNLKDRYLPWIATYDGYKVVNASIWNDNRFRASIFTTSTPEMVSAKQAAIAATGVSGVIINDDNMGDCGLESLNRQDLTLAHSHGFQVFGERVPNTCSWADVYAMWSRIEPDGFINIGTPDAYWMGQFRALYGPATEPLGQRIYLPLAIRN